MEVSSHALAMHRVDGIHFDVAVFTNLGHDHLDYHGTMERYFATKAALFAPEHAVLGVVNTDDRWGRRLLADARIPLVAVRGERRRAVELAPGSSPRSPGGASRGVTALTGPVNVHNALLAAEAAVVLGVDPAEVAGGLGQAAPVAGRFEVVVSPGRATRASR